MTTTIPGIGKGKLGGSGFFKNYRLEVPKKGETETVARYRLLPPMKSCAEKGQWSYRVAQHFGYKGRDRQDPTKLKMRPFACIQKKKFNSDIIEAPCKACDEKAAVEAKVEKILDDMKKEVLAKEGKTLSDKEVKELAKDITQVHAAWLKDHNVDAKHHMFVMDEQGDFGDLQVTGKCKIELDNRIKDCLAMEVDPWDIEQGVWFEFHRSGTDFNNLTDTVQIYKTKERNPNGPGFIETLKLAPITVEQIKRAMEILPELTDVVRHISAAGIKLIVESKGDPTVVDAVFDGAAKVPEKTADVSTAAKAVAAAAATGSNPQDEIEALKLKLAALEAQKTPNSAVTQNVPAPVEETKVPTTEAGVVGSGEVDYAKVTNADFKKNFGLKTGAGA